MFKIQNTYDKYVTKTFRLPKEMAENLEQLAFINDISFNKLVVQCLKYALDNLEKPEKRSDL